MNTNSADKWRIERTDEQTGYGRTWLIYRPDGSVDETDAYRTKAEAMAAMRILRRANQGETK